MVSVKIYAGIILFFEFLFVQNTKIDFNFWS